MSSSSQPPALLNDRFHVGEEIGRGRFGTTWHVLDEETGKEYALKRVSLARAMAAQHHDVESFSGPAWEKHIEMFRREADVLRQMDHNGVPDYVDFFTIRSAKDVELCLVQEYIKGRTLEELMSKGPRPSREEVFRIALSCAEILVYLHSREPPVIHRDIKPSNIMISEGGQVYLVDFGAVMETLNDQTGGSTIVGTFGYMPLEQYEGRATPASDIYALGVTLVHCLSGKAPRELERSNMRLVYEPFVELPVEHSRLLDTMIAADPATRPQDGGDLSSAVRALLEGVSSPASTEAPVPSSPSVAAVLECQQCGDPKYPSDSWKCTLCGLRWKALETKGVCPTCGRKHNSLTCQRCKAHIAVAKLRKSSPLPVPEASSTVLSCKSCGHSMGTSDSWRCQACGRRWHALETKGRCPSCSHHQRALACHKCGSHLMLDPGAPPSVIRTQGKWIAPAVISGIFGFGFFNIVLDNIGQLPESVATFLSLGLALSLVGAFYLALKSRTQSSQDDGVAETAQQHPSKDSAHGEKSNDKAKRAHKKQTL